MIIWSERDVFALLLRTIGVVVLYDLFFSFLFLKKDVGRFLMFVVHFEALVCGTGLVAKSSECL